MAKVKDPTKKELQKELAELEKHNLVDGLPTNDSVPQELKRIKEIAGLIAQHPGDPGGKHQSPPITTHPTSLGDSEEIKKLKAENQQLKDAQARSAAGNKIKSADKKHGYIPRPDEIMGKALDNAESIDPSDWDDSTKLAVERAIRRFVRKGGSRKNHKGDFYDLAAGFKKGVTIGEKAYALGLLEKMGRLKGTAKDIIALIEKRETLPIGEQRQTAKEFNQKLESLGVVWDDSIQVPGMSAQLRS